MLPPLTDKVQEVLQPAKILDIECADSIDYVAGAQVMRGAYLVTAISERRQFVFLTKMNKRQKDGSTKSRVKRVDTTVSLAEPSHGIVYATVVGETSLQTVYGNVLQLMQASFNIVEAAKAGAEAAPSILKSLQLQGLQTAGKASKKGKKSGVNEEEYEVTGYED